MRLPHVGQLVNGIEFFRGQGRLGRILDHHPVAVALDDRLAPHRIVLVLLDAAGDRVLLFPRLVGNSNPLEGGTLCTRAGTVVLHRHLPAHTPDVG